MWQCELCNTSNDDGAASCKVCGMSRPAGAKPAGRRRSAVVPTAGSRNSAVNDPYTNSANELFEDRPKKPAVNRRRKKNRAPVIIAVAVVLVLLIAAGGGILMLESRYRKAGEYYAAGDYEQKSLMDLVSNIKEDRSELDLLFGCILEWNLPLTLSHTSEQVDGVSVHTYAGGEHIDLMACFDPNMSEAVVRHMAQKQPLGVVFRDSSFAASPAKINVTEIFKTLSPHTTIKVL